MSTVTSSRPPVKAPTLAAYHAAIARVLRSLEELQDAGEHVQAMPPSGFAITGEPDGWDTWELVCEDLQALLWAAGKAQPFLASVAERAAGTACRRQRCHAAERLARDEATMPGDDGVDLSTL